MENHEHHHTTPPKKQPHRLPLMTYTTKVAAGLFYPKLMISPAFGAVLMSVSTIVVALNAQLLKKDLVAK